MGTWNKLWSIIYKEKNLKHAHTHTHTRKIYKTKQNKTLEKENTLFIPIIVLMFIQRKASKFL